MHSSGCQELFPIGQIKRALPDDLCVLTPPPTHTCTHTHTHTQPPSAVNRTNRIKISARRCVRVHPLPTFQCHSHGPQHASAACRSVRGIWAFLSRGTVH
jgi:hypothetical protein